jgi:hypothetical protein
MIPAILIIGYERPENVALILKSLKEYQNNIYLFVDFDEKYRSAENLLMIKHAREYAEEGRVSLFIAEKNYSVGGAVPAAIDWVLGLEESVIVLEDDCVPNKHTIPYLSNMLLLTQKEDSILLVSGSNPVSKNLRVFESSISSFPLIWGWAIWKSNWVRIAPYVRREVRPATILYKFLLNPRKMIAKSFFTAAYLRSRSEITKAWDCNLALGMLMESYFATVPNENTITNIGNDGVASHTIYESESAEIIVASNQRPSEIVSMNCKSIDLAISNEIYHLRARHLLSPVKAFIQILQNKARNAFEESL